MELPEYQPIATPCRANMEVLAVPLRPNYKFIRAQHGLHLVLVMTRLFVFVKKRLSNPDVLCCRYHSNIELKLDARNSEQVSGKGHYLLFMFKVLKRNICSSRDCLLPLFSPGLNNDSSLEAQGRAIINY